VHSRSFRPSLWLRALARVAIPLVLLGQCSSTSFAVTTSWNVDTNGSFTTAGNWNNGVPDSADVAVFDRGSGVAYTVTLVQLLGSDIINSRLVVGSNTVTFNPGAGAPDYFLGNTSTTEADPILGLPVRGITIGAEANDTAAVLVSHLSLLEAVAATLGHAVGSSGTLTLNQSNDRLNLTGGSTTDAELIVGRLGTGILNVAAGADVTVNGLAAGFPAGSVILGRSSSGQGTANIGGAGSTLDVNAVLIIGDSGSGTLNVTTGGHVEVVSGFLGNLANSTGTATIDGAGSTWSNVALFVGEFGDGMLEITGGGVVDSQTARLAGQTSSISTATVSGGGSTLNSTTSLEIGLRGNGTMNVTAGGHVNSGESFIGDLAASHGTVNVDGTGSLWANSNTLYVGKNGDGKLIINAGGHVTSTAPTFGTAGYIAREIGSTGAVTVDGEDSTWTNNGALIVGSRGDATLDVTAGGQVTSGTSFVGDDGAATGEVSIDGAGSKWSSSGVLFAAWDGSATINITGGGGLETSGGAIGEQAGSTGHVSVDGAASTWTNTNVLAVGDFGNGTLDVTAGGHVSNTTGYIGALAGSTGEVLVDGAGSLWTNTSDLYIGNIGQGTLSVQNGGMVEVGGNLSLNTSSTANLQAAAIGGNVANSGHLNFRGNAQIGGSLTVAVDADLVIDSAQPCCSATVEVGGPVSNSGTFTMRTDSAAPCCGMTLDLAPGQTFTNNATGVVNFEGPADAGGEETIQSKHIIDGSVVNSGQMNVRTNAQVTGSLTTNVDAETVVEPATPCCGMTLEVAGPVANSGTFTVRNTVAAGAAAESGGGASSHQDVTLQADGGFTNSGTFTMQIDSIEPCCNVKLQLGVGQTFTNDATGVVNLNGPADVDEGATIESKQFIGGDVVNNGQMNVRSNTQIDGSLTIAVDAETLIAPIQPCCSMTLELSGPVSNSGQFTLMPDALDPCCNLTVELGAGETFTNNATGIVKGTGVIDADVLNHGRVEPGNSAGVLTVTGDFTQANDGKLVVEVAGTTAGSQYDQLVIGGAIALDGVVEVVFDEDFVPQVGNRFEIITTAEPIGANKFAGASLPGLPEGMDWGIHYEPNVVALAISIPGDYSGNGVVDAADYTVWRNSLGQTGVFLAADGDGDDVVDADDYDFWKMHFGETVGGGSAGASPSQYAVPEPGALLYLLCGMIAATIRRVVPWPGSQT
jgi:T5SS/PEP-CTERM-associated repeat protein